MTYGLTAINDSSYVQIDPENPRLCAIYSGVYSSTSYICTVSFPAPITTQEPPCIFIRNSQGNIDDIYTDMTVLGSAGSWTGFRITAYNIDMRPAGKWFASVFAAKATADYGMRMWSSTGALIYDTGTVPVLFTRANHSWSYIGKNQINPVTVGYTWRNTMQGTLLADEYFMINPFSRGLLSPASLRWTPIGVRFNYNQSCLEVYGITALGTWADFGSPGAVFARLPAT